jgi:hypothetical protein
MIAILAVNCLTPSVHTSKAYKAYDLLDENKAFYTAPEDLKDELDHTRKRLMNSLNAILDAEDVA